MQLRSAFAALLTLACLPGFSQNVNTTFRSKISYPGQTLANVWGYETRGKEYALVGGSLGLIIVDITNPDTPQQIVQIPGPNNLWKEIKTYKNYAYVVSEGGQGIQVVNLSDLPSATLPSHFYKGDGVIAGQLNKIHALHIDETKGFLYAWGGDLFNGGAKIFDLKPDPYNPIYVGKYTQLGYIHDGYVDNDTMYSGHIYDGQFAIVNMADKSAPELINTQTTPNAFTHNTWLTPDRKTLLTTDERTNSFLAAYDVSDPTDIQFLDKMQTSPGSNSIVHNTYAMRNWAITSWYKEGFNIVDITRPANLIEIGKHDTYPSGTGDGFDGCWGVYPYFPSGNIIASNISVGGAGELWIVTPNYVRACYLEGKITNALTGLPLANAQIQVLGTSPLLQETSTNNGLYKTGQQAEGYYTVRVTKSGYQDFETSVYFQRGELIELNVPLFPSGLASLSGTVIHHDDGLPVEGANVWLFGNQNFSAPLTDANGAFSLNNIPQGTYDIAASAPNLGLGILAGQAIVGATNVTIELFSTHRRDAVIGQNDDQAFSNTLIVKQNPFATETLVEFRTDGAPSALVVMNNLGQVVENHVLSGLEGQLRIGQTLPNGVYFAALQQNGKTLEVKRLVKN